MIGDGTVELNNDTIKKIRELIAFIVVVVATGINHRRLVDAVAGLMHVVWPFIPGAAIAFILNVPIRNTERHLPVFGEGNRLRRPTSLVVTILLVTEGLFLVIFVVAPQLVKAFLNLQGNIFVFFAGVRDEAERILASSPQTLGYINQLEVDWQEIFQNTAALLKSGARTMLGITLLAAAFIVSDVSSFLIGFIFVIYILLRKETLGRQMRKVLAAFLPEPTVGRIPGIMVLAERVFSNSLTGQRVKAVILGTMPFVTPTAIRLPYVLLAGVLITLMALIPIFGTFARLAVGVFLMFMISPMDALAFTTTFFVLQQIEGDPVYLRVMGSSVGLPSIRVLVAVTMGGSMMGIMGMFTFIPLCPVLYALLRDGVNAHLRRKSKGESAREPICVAVSEENEGQEHQE